MSIIQPGSQGRGMSDATAEARAAEILKFSHTLQDIKTIASRTGEVKLYHGAPTKFAELLVQRGPNAPYAVEDTARYVASVYGLSWYEFRLYAYRAGELVQRLSTSTAPIASRWAWTFPLGEILTDLNSHARMVVAAKQVATHKGIKVEDAYEEVYEKASSLAKERGTHVTSDSAPDVLGLPDKLRLDEQTGALVELVVDARAVSDHAVSDARRHLKALESGECTERVMLLLWNHQYIDIRVAPQSIKSARIVVRGMESWEQEAVEDIWRKTLTP